MTKLHTILRFIANICHVLFRPIMELDLENFPMLPARDLYDFKDKEASVPILSLFSCSQCKINLHTFDRLQRHKYRHRMKYIGCRRNEGTFWTKKASIYRYCGMFNCGGYVSHRLQKDAQTRNVNKVEKLVKCKCCLKTLGCISLDIPSQVQSTTYFIDCKDCKKRFSELTCVHCHKCYANQSLLQKHMQTHNKPKKLRKRQCELCEKHFPNRFYLKKHITSAHSKKKTHPHETSSLSDKTTHQSELCEERSPIGSHPKRYIASAHSKNKTQQCESRAPSKKTTHQCELCKKHFFNLKRHMKSCYLKKKTYQCEHCGRCFGKKWHLMAHNWQK